MQTRQIDSAVFPTEDAARASVDGVLASLSSEGELEVISITVKEVEDGFVAVLVVGVSEPEPEAEEEGEKGGEDRSLGVPEDVKEEFNHGIALWGHHSVLNDAHRVGEAFQEEPVHEAMHDIEPEQEYYDSDDNENREERSQTARLEDFPDTVPDVLETAPEARTDLREELATDFQESAPPVVPPNLYLTEEEIRDLPEEDRRRLAELRAQPQAPAPAPENTA